MNNPAEQLFIQEALELLQEIREGLQGLSCEPNPNTTETLIRAAQIIQGGAAYSNFPELSTLTRRLEQILSYLWREQIEIDSSLTDQLLKICDCILLLLDQNPSNRQDPATALAQAEPVLTDLELRLSQPHMTEATSGDLNDIVQTIEQIELALVVSEDYELLEALKNHAKNLLSQSQILDCPEIVGIAQTMLASLDISPQSAAHIGQIALTALQETRSAILGTQASSSTSLQKPDLLPSQPDAPFSSPSSFEPTSSQPASTAIQNNPVAPSDYTLETKKLLVWLWGSAVFILPYESIQENLNIGPDEIFQVGNKRFLEWQGQMIPLFRLYDFLKRNLIPGIEIGKVIEDPSGSNLKEPLRVVIKFANQVVAVEVSIEKLITQSQLAIDRFASALSPAAYCCGFTVLEGERLATVIDVVSLLDHIFSQSSATNVALSSPAEPASPFVEGPLSNQTHPGIITAGVSTVLVVDNALDHSSELVLTLQGLGCQVSQLQNGQEVISKLRNDSTIKLVICEFDAPELTDLLFLNDLMFLAYRLKDAQLAKIPVVLISPCHSSRLQRIAMLMGATTYFAKPYDPMEFSTKIQQLMKLTEDSNE